MKKNLWIACFLMAFISLYFVVDTMALLESSGEAIIEKSVGKWEITLNDLDITLNDTLTFDDFLYAENENVQEGYFAPGTEASYEIEVNPGNTDVSIRYDITVNFTNLENHPNIYASVKAGETELTGMNGTYSGVMSLSDIKNGKTLILDIILIWEDDENYNEADGVFGQEDASFTIPITMKFSQYLGENI